MKSLSDWIDETFELAKAQMMEAIVNENPALLNGDPLHTGVLVTSLHAIQFNCAPGLLTIGLNNWERTSDGVQSELERLAGAIVQAQLFYEPSSATGGFVDG